MKLSSKLSSKLILVVIVVKIFVHEKLFVWLQIKTRGKNMILKVENSFYCSAVYFLFFALFSIFVYFI